MYQAWYLPTIASLGYVHASSSLSVVLVPCWWSAMEKSRLSDQVMHRCGQTFFQWSNMSNPSKRVSKRPEGALVHAGVNNLEHFALCVARMGPRTLWTMGTFNPKTATMPARNIVLVSRMPKLIYSFARENIPTHIHQTHRRSVNPSLTHRFLRQHNT